MDLLLGRQPLTADGDAGAGCGGGGCGCPLGGGAGPCGAQLVVHVPLATALGVGDVPAELVGHGPIDPDELARLLLAAPALQAVFVDEHGVPVAAADEVLQPERGDQQAVRAALLDVARLRPSEYFPRHPDDHPAPPDPAPPPPGDDASSPTPPHRHLPPDPWAVLAAATLGTPTPRAGRTRLGNPAPTASGRGCAGSCGCAHPAASGPAAEPAPPAATSTTTTPGPQARPARATSGRCAAGTTAPSRTAGPRPDSRTAASAGPARTAAAGPAPSSTPRPGCRPDRSRGSPTTPVGSHPAALLEEQLHADPADPRWTGLHTDPAWLSAAPDHDPHTDTDHLGQRLRNGATAWDLDLLDAYAWTDEIPLPELE
jgi:hypothetical protein